MHSVKTTPTCVSYCKQDKTRPEKSRDDCQSAAQPRSSIQLSSSKSEFIQYTKQQENISWRLSITSMYF